MSLNKKVEPVLFKGSFPFCVWCEKLPFPLPSALVIEENCKKKKKKNRAYKDPASLRAQEIKLSHIKCLCSFKTK